MPASKTKQPTTECAITTKYSKLNQQWESSCACGGFSMGVPDPKAKEGAEPPKSIAANADLHLARHRQRK